MPEEWRARGWKGPDRLSAVEVGREVALCQESGGEGISIPIQPDERRIFRRVRPTSMREPMAVSIDPDIEDSLDQAQALVFHRKPRPKPQDIEEPVDLARDALHDLCRKIDRGILADLGADARIIIYRSLLSGAIAAADFEAKRDRVRVERDAIQSRGLAACSSCGALFERRAEGDPPVGLCGPCLSEEVGRRG